MNKKHHTLLLIVVTAFFSCKKNTSTDTSTNINTCVLNKISGTYNGDNNFEQTYLYNSLGLLSEMKTKDYDYLLNYNTDKHLINITFSSSQENKIFDINWNGNQVNNIKQSTTYNGVKTYREYQPIYQNNKIIKITNIVGLSPNSYTEGYDSLAYDLAGNINKYYHYTTFGGSKSSDITTISYDNEKFCGFSYEITPFEPFLLFINQTPNNPVTAKTTGDSTWSGYNITYEYDSDKKPTSIIGTYQEQPLNLTLTYNCK